MKKFFPVFILILIMSVRCTQEKKSPNEGAWQLVYAEWQGIDGTFPDSITGSDIKIWSTDYFSSTGKLHTDTITYNVYVCGKYSLEGTHYVEDIMFHTIEGNVGEKIRMLLEIKSDTLIQIYPVNDNWQLPEKFSIEKYVRLK